MSDKTFDLQVITPEGVVFDEAVVAVKLPAALGSMGVLANHAPFASPLDVGEMRVKEAGRPERIFAIGEGFVEIGRNRCRVLTDSREEAGGIDLARAEQAVDRARRRLRERSSETDVPRAEAALRRAMMRLRIGRGGR